jgi:hypothetical protein
MHLKEIPSMAAPAPTVYDVQTHAAADRLISAAMAAKEALARGDTRERLERFVNEAKGWASALDEDIHRPWSDSAKPIAELIAPINRGIEQQQSRRPMPKAEELRS